MGIELTLLNLGTNELLLQVGDFRGYILRDMRDLDALSERLVFSGVGHFGVAVKVRRGWKLKDNPRLNRRTDPIESAEAV